METRCQTEHLVSVCGLFCKYYRLIKVWTKTELVVVVVHSQAFDIAPVMGVLFRRWIQTAFDSESVASCLTPTRRPRGRRTRLHALGLSSVGGTSEAE